MLILELDEMRFLGRAFAWFCAAVVLGTSAYCAKRAERKGSLGLRQLADWLFYAFLAIATGLMFEMHENNSRDFYYAFKSWGCALLWGITFFIVRSDANSFRAIKKENLMKKLLEAISILGTIWVVVALVGTIVFFGIGNAKVKAAPRETVEVYDDFCVELVTQYVGDGSHQTRIGIGDGRLLFYYKNGQGKSICIDVPTDSVTLSKADDWQHGCSLPCLERNRTEHRYRTYYNGDSEVHVESVDDNRTYTLYIEGYDSLPGDCRGVIPGDDGSDNAT